MVELSAIKKTRRLKTIKAAKIEYFIRFTDLHQPELNSNRGDLSRPQRGKAGDEFLVVQTQGDFRSML